MNSKVSIATLLMLCVARVVCAQGLPSADAIPFVDQSAKDRWSSYVSAKGHKAYAVGENGSWGWEPRKETEEQAKVAALNRCERLSFPCYLFAVNDTVVWDQETFRQALKPRISPLSGTSIVAGRSTFAVPEEPWLVASSQVRAGGDTSNQVVEAYGLLLTPEGRFKAAFFHSARRSSYVDASAGTRLMWSDSTCDKSDTIYFDKLAGQVMFPECLVIDFFADPESTSGWDRRVWYWVRANGIKLTGTTISSSYVKYKGGDFARVTYWINPSEFDVPSRGEIDRNKSPWNPKNLGVDPKLAGYVEQLKAWSLEMAANGRASVEKAFPAAGKLRPFPFVP